MLTLIRHAQTEANAAHLLQGSSDSPLTALCDPLWIINLLLLFVSTRPLVLLNRLLAFGASCEWTSDSDAAREPPVRVTSQSQSDLPVEMTTYTM